MPSIESTSTGNTMDPRAISEAMPNTFSISGNVAGVESLLRRGRFVAQCRIAHGGNHEASSTVRASIHGQTSVPHLPGYFQRGRQHSVLLPKVRFCGHRT